MPSWEKETGKIQRNFEDSKGGNARGLFELGASDEAGKRQQWRILVTALCAAWHEGRLKLRNNNNNNNSNSNITNNNNKKKKREREMFYLTTHSTHFIYGYMASESSL